MDGFYFLLGNPGQTSTDSLWSDVSILSRQGLLLCLPRMVCSLEERACFAGLGKCGQLILTCNDKTTIKILSAQYGLGSTTCSISISVKDCVEYKEKCCVPSHSNPKLNDFSNGHLKRLNDRCTGKHSCVFEAVRDRLQQYSKFSNVVTVNYTCQNAQTTQEETSTGEEEEPSGGSSTAAVVVPVIAVVVLAGVAVACVVYWRRKKSLEKERRIEKGQRNCIPAPVHNPGYDYTDQNKDSSKSPDTECTDDETVYHTIDPDSIPDKVVTNDYLELYPADDYNVIGENDADNKTVTNDYFILENQGDTTDRDEVDYNKINLKANGIVKDPNYQRLAAVDQNPKAEANEDNENYSHLGSKFPAEEKDEEMKAGDIKSDDYAHLNKDSI